MWALTSLGQHEVARCSRPSRHRPRSDGAMAAMRSRLDQHVALCAQHDAQCARRSWFRARPRCVPRAHELQAQDARGPEEHESRVRMQPIADLHVLAASSFMPAARAAARAAARRNRCRRDTGAPAPAMLSRVTDAVGMTTPNCSGRRRCRAPCPSAAAWR